MTLFSQKVLLRAALFGVALFFGWNAGATKVETYQDLIEKAYNLSLQKDRLQAINLLVSATQKESKKGPPPKELLVALEEVSTVFYSDKAQQTFELALSLRSSDPALAVSKLNEAARLEPDNLQIMLEQIRLQISSGDCDGALKVVQKHRERNPYSEDLRLVLAQSLVCHGKFQEFQALRGPGDLKKNGRELYWQRLDLEHAFRTGAFAKGRDLAVQFSKNEPTFPEFFYWTWKLNQSLKVVDERSGTKYLTMCKSLSSRLMRQFQAEPRLCRNVAEVEAETKKNVTPSE